MNNKSPKKILIALLFMLATLAPFSSYSQSQQLKTIPSGASITDENDKEIGQTPVEISSIIAKSKKIKIRKEGYETILISFPEKMKKILPFPSCISYCDDCKMIFDNYPGEKNSIYSGTLVLRKKIAESDKPIFITVDTPMIRMPAETVLGRINGSEKRLNTKDIHTYIGYVENMNNEALSAFVGTYVLPVFSNKDSKEKTNLFRGKIIFKPVITKLSFDLEGNLFRDFAGPCVMDCEWNISLLNNKKVLAKIPVTSVVYRSGNNYEIILHQMIQASERDLLENDTLADYLKTLETAYFAGLKSDPLELKKVPSEKFASKQAMLKSTSASVVTVVTDDGFGSGTIISKDGYLITNHHVIEDGGEIFIKTKDDVKLKATIVKKLSDFDIALLKIDQSELKPIPFGDSEKSSAGDEVFAIGTPLDKSLGQTITKGIISGYREWNGVTFIQTDVSINSGNSGGPLLNEDGELIGITTMKLSGKDISGIGFCIPVDVIKQRLNLKLN